MMEHTPSRAEAWDLLVQYNASESLQKHALAVEGVMRHMARRDGQDEHAWGMVGLLHDLDYEQFPEQHCAKTREILEAHRYPAAWIRAIMAHGWPAFSDVEPQTLIEKTLYAVDELAGFAMACALVRPSRSVLDMEIASVLKKWKRKEFAAGVDRGVVERGAAMLEIELSELTGEVIAGLRGVADEIGLRGTIS